MTSSGLSEDSCEFYIHWIVLYFEFVVSHIYHEFWEIPKGKVPQPFLQSHWNESDFLPRQKISWNFKYFVPFSRVFSLSSSEQIPRNFKRKVSN